LPALDDALSHVSNATTNAATNAATNEVLSRSPVAPLSHADLSAPTAAFTVRAQQGAAWQRWRWAFWLLLACGAVYVAGVWWHSRNLLALEKQAQQAVTAAFNAAMPANTPVSDPIKQMQQVLNGNASSAGAGAGGKAGASNAFSQAIAQLPADWPSGVVTALAWQTKRLSVTVSSAHPTFQGMDEAQKNTLASDLSAKGINLVWGKP
jgi:hypothetical protein